MEHYIEELVEELFKEYQYTKDILEKKQKAKILLIQLYQTKCENLNKVEALNEIIKEYKTLEDIEKLIGNIEENVGEKKIVENELEITQLKKMFFVKKSKIFLLSIFTFLLINICITGILSLEIKQNIMNILFLLGFIPILFLANRVFQKNQKSYSYKMTKSSFEYFEKKLELYRTRVLYSLMIFGGGLLYTILVYNCIYYKKDEEMTIILASINPILFFVLLYFYNENIRRWFESFQMDLKQSIFEKFQKKMLCLVIVYLIVIGTILAILKKNPMVLFNVFHVSVLLYIILFGYYIYSIKKKYRTKNYKISKKKIAIVCSIVLCFSLFQGLKIDTWILNPYISTIPQIEYEQDDIEYDDETGIYSITTDKENFKILQLTDIHLGGSIMSYGKDYKALNAVYKLIENTRPDLVIVTGDLVFPLGIFSYSLNNVAPVIQFNSFMRNIGIPWAFAYGNHDTENIATGTVEDVKKVFVDRAYKTSKTLLYPYIQPEITGRNNQIIKIKNEDGTLRQALFILDSNDYIGNGLNEYDYIHDDQVEWYAKNIKELQENYGKDVSSLLFFHMPLQEYKIANDLYEQKSDDIKYFFGVNAEKMIDKVCCSKIHSKIFDTALELGSTKAMFCGHDHYNNTSFEYKGIRLTYGMSIDYLAMPGIAKHTEQRGGTLITLLDDSTYTIEQIKLKELEK